MDDDLIESNPLAGWRYTRKEAAPKDSDVDPLAADEQRAILANLPPEMANLIHFAFWTGLRTSEIIALDWADVDFRRGTLTVKRALTRAAKGIPEQPKTKAGIREVKLLTPAPDVLKHQKGATFVGGTGAIFQNPATNERWSDAQIYRAWGTAMKRAGVRYRRPYQTRHTYASMMLSAREHPMWVASQMGHRDWTMIARIYGKWIPEADTTAGEKAVSLFAPTDRMVKCKTPA
ncbi:site-specific integrase [Alcaligenaceae bacterium B3P038]|nr:site-specific integrase [Alcaligenaceae bacterium B3P038]